MSEINKFNDLHEAACKLTGTYSSEGDYFSNEAEILNNAGWLVGRAGLAIQATLMVEEGQRLMRSLLELDESGDKEKRKEVALECWNWANR